MSDTSNAKRNKSRFRGGRWSQESIVEGWRAWNPYPPQPMRVLSDDERRELEQQLKRRDGKR